MVNRVAFFENIHGMGPRDYRFCVFSAVRVDAKYGYPSSGSAWNEVIRHPGQRRVMSGFPAKISR